MLDVEARLDDLMRPVVHGLLKPPVGRIVQLAIESSAVDLPSHAECEFRVVMERIVEPREPHPQIALEEDLVVYERVILQYCGRADSGGLALGALPEVRDQGALHCIREAPHVDAGRMTHLGKPSFSEPSSQVWRVKM